MCKDKKMFALIIAIFVMVLFITGWVFADRNVMDLISATPIFEAKNAVSEPLSVELPENPAINLPSADEGMCSMDGFCS